MSPEAKKTKAKINYWDYIIIKSLCTSEQTINKTERQCREWEKIFVNNISDKELVSKIYELNTKKYIYPIKKWAEEMNRHFSKEDTQIANRHMKRCSISLIIRETDINITIRYYFTPVKMAKIKTTSVDEDVEEKGSFVLSWWEQLTMEHSMEVV